ncbi:MAG: hypothetical protein U1E16_16195 [Hyphomicrobiales bacterium]
MKRPYLDLLSALRIAALSPSSPCVSDVWRDDPQRARGAMSSFRVGQTGFSLQTNSLAFIRKVTYIGLIEFWPDGSASRA